MFKVWKSIAILTAASAVSVELPVQKRVELPKTKFMDFRYLDEYAGLPELKKSSDATKNAPVTSDYFNSNDWTSMWDIQNWGTEASGDAKVATMNSKNNVYIEKNSDSGGNGSWLTLRTARQGDFQSIAEFDSVSKKFQYLDITMYARVNGSSGACLSMFTYLNDSSEIDIEILNKDPKNEIWYTNQPGQVEGSEANPQVSTLDWSQWSEHRLVWQPESTTFYVNGVQTGHLTASVPTDAMPIMFNAWSKGQSGWEGTMDDGGVAYLQIQYINLKHNNADVN